jgi:hypothetical protein
MIRPSRAYEKGIAQQDDAAIVAKASMAIRARTTAPHSSRRLPAPALLQRSYVETTGSLRPWLVTDVVAPERLGDRLSASFGAAPEPVELSNPDSLSDVPLRRFATLEIGISDELAGRPLFLGRGRRITQEDFPELLAEIRRQSRKELGPRADRSD